MLCECPGCKHIARTTVQALGEPFMHLCTMHGKEFRSFLVFGESHYLGKYRKPRKPCRMTIWRRKRRAEGRA